MEDTTRAKGRDETTVMEEQMEQGTPEGAAYPRGRRWRTARRSNDRDNDMKGTKKKVINTVKCKEWTGNAMGKRKRIWEEEGGTQEALDGGSMGQELENAPNGGGHHLTRHENGGGQIPKVGGNHRTGKKKTQDTSQQNYRLFW